MKVYVVEHVHSITKYNEQIKFIGVYSSEENAKRAVARLSQQPGFDATPEGFCVNECEVDKDEWAEGFFTWDPTEES